MKTSQQTTNQLLVLITGLLLLNTRPSEDTTLVTKVLDALAAEVYAESEDPPAEPS